MKLIELFFFFLLYFIFGICNVLAEHELIRDTQRVQMELGATVGNTNVGETPVVIIV